MKSHRYIEPISPDTKVVALQSSNSCMYICKLKTNDIFTNSQQYRSHAVFRMTDKRRYNSIEM